MSHDDVIVVGAGLAGLTAAVRLAESGARVRVLAKGVGATHLAGATIDVLGYTPARVEKPGEALGAFIAEHPEHPYARVGLERVAASIEWFKARIAAGPLAPYAYTGSLDENLLLPTAVGVPKPSAIVPETMASGDVRGGGRILVVGFAGLKDFHPALAADGLQRTVSGVEARGIMLDLRPEGRAEVNSLALARALDDREFRRRAIGQLAPRLHPDESVAFPAALGMRAPHEVWSDIEHGLGAPVFEVPTLPPSVPGMRVFEIFRAALRRAGVSVLFNNIVVGAEADGTRVRALRVKRGLREERLGADWVVLATGGIASGGVELDSHWHAREVALGLPVVGVPGPGEARMDPDYFAAHPMSAAGVATDARLRPLGVGGEPAYENVLVAGATLAGAVPWKEKSGDGLSLATGYTAAGLVLAETTTAQEAIA